MTPHRWQQIDAILDAVIDLAPADRPARLDALCSTDPDLRQEVEDLLQAEVPNFLEEEAGAFIGPALEAGESLGARQMVGPYRLLREVGRGGMGIVYLAERDDVDRQVALKLVRGGLADPALRQRFLHEQRVLARLEHPHIARLYDVGIAEDDTPYFALEYVEGQSLDAYCDAHQLSLEQRLELFTTVGQAVQHAHQHFVVHRDLKPSNILVAEDGAGRAQVKLLDFGIAKVLADAEDVGEAMTQTGRHLLTPAYAAPEQIRGEAVTAATDVYALGVVLYELLTGRRPYNVTGRGGAEAVLTQEPRKPSTAVTDETSGTTTTETTAARATTVDRLQRQLRGDLDVICLKALAKEPERRYASAEAFVEDIRRHLAGLPVVARPATAGYRTKKFVQRHRQAVLALATVVTLLVLVVFFYTTRLQEQRNTAQLEAKKAQEVTGFVLGLFSATNPNEAQGDTLTAPELLHRGAERTTTLADQPLVQAKMIDVIGKTYQSLGRFREADSLLRQALAIRQRHLESPHPELAENLYAIGWIQNDQGHYEAADSFYTKALAMTRLLHDNEGVEVVTIVSRLGGLRWLQGRYDESEGFLREAIALHRKNLGPRHQSVATTMTSLALVMEDKGEYEAARELYEELLPIYEDALGPSHPHAITARSNYAFFLSSIGAYNESLRRYREVLTMRREVLGEVHPGVAFTLAGMGTVAHRMDSLEAAAQHMREAISTYYAAVGDSNVVVGNYLSRLAAILLDQGQYEEADGLLQHALAIQRRILGDEHPNVASSLKTLGRLRMQTGAYKEAEVHLQQALAIQEARLGAQHDQVKKTRQYLADLYDAWGKPAEAEKYRESVEAIAAPE